MKQSEINAAFDLLPTPPEGQEWELITIADDSAEFAIFTRTFYASVWVDSDGHHATVSVDGDHEESADPTENMTLADAIRARLVWAKVEGWT